MGKLKKRERQLSTFNLLDINKQALFYLLYMAKTPCFIADFVKKQGVKVSLLWEGSHNMMGGM